ncbi:MAG: ABC transporter ATP-binding protein [Thermotogae bacterium]|nr:ABC transporter ATP-binding protein [Thermotogota bacterium]
MSEVIRVVKVHKTYKNGVEALKGVSTIVKRGSIHALLGPNGAGKTTLMKSIMGLIRLTRGKIFVLDREVDLSGSASVGRIAFLPEEKQLYGNRKVSKMLALAREISTMWNETRAKKLLEEFPLDLNKKVSQLSHGQRTQLYLIITFAQDIPIWMLDEPTWGLDPVVSEKVLLLMKEFVVDSEKTILYASHNLSEVEEVADTVTIIDRGKVVCEGEIDELKDKIKMLKISPSGKVQVQKDKLVGLMGVKYKAGDILFIVNDHVEENAKRLSEYTSGENVEILNVTLKDIFLSLVDRRRSN